MGLFDNVLKSLDSTLKAIEDGAIEKTLTQAVDMFDNHVGKVPETLEKVANAPQKLINTADTRVEQLRETGEKLKEQATKATDIIKRV